jgi:anoctamin-10
MCTTSQLANTSQVAFYYAFIQCYSIFLIAPTACGILAWLFSGPYSPSFAIFTCLWGILFVEYWKREEVDLSIRWDVRGVGELKVNRPQYVWEREETDPVTGEVKRIFPTHKRVLRQLWFLPFAALAGLALGTVLLVTFALEALMSDVYGKLLEERWYLQYLPTILLSVALPYVTSILTDLATKLTDYENYRTKDQYDLAGVQKSFVLNFITNYFPIVITAYVYIPYGARLIPLITPTSWNTANVVNSFDVDPARLQEEVISLSMAAQVMNFGEEFLYPYLKRQAKTFWRNYNRKKRAATFHQRDVSSPEESKLFRDNPEEAQLMARLRHETHAEEYDVHEDIMEMVVQFGYLTLFAPAWPLMPLGFLLNNWVELRGDFFKLSSESQRPPPIRSDSIGDSVAALEFLTWLGTLSTAALVHIYGGEGSITDTRPSRLLLTIFVAEQAYLAVRIGARFFFTRFGSAAVRDAEAKRFMMRKTYLETFSEEKAGTSRRVRSRTYAGERRGSSQLLAPPNAPTPDTPVEGNDGLKSPGDELETQLPTISVNGEQPAGVPQEFDREYSTEEAERFWTESPEVYETAEAGVRLIVALKSFYDKDGGAGKGDDRSKAD